MFVCACICNIFVNLPTLRTPCNNRPTDTGSQAAAAESYERGPSRRCTASGQSVFFCIAVTGHVLTF